MRTLSGAASIQEECDPLLQLFAQFLLATIIQPTACSPEARGPEVPPGTAGDGSTSRTLCTISICEYVNRQFLGTHNELGSVTFFVTDIELESLRHDDNESMEQRQFELKF